MHTQPGHLRIHGDWKREVFMFSTTCSGIWKGGDCGQYLRWLHDGMMAWYNQMAKVRKHFFWLISICCDSGPSKLQISAGQPSHLPDEGAGFKVQRKREETRCGIASSNGGIFRSTHNGFFPWGFLQFLKRVCVCVCLWGRNAVVYFLRAISRFGAW